ncbi:MAG: RluA family pseudouridine synthase [Bacilli bacterium]|nr:RluA family pseudouridine synthase [Bacilli bacterium]
MKLVVEKNGELLDYLYQKLEMPKKRIKQYLTHGSIYVNNNKVTKYNYPLIAGMNIVIATDSKGKKECPFSILFEDNHIIVVNKPSGLLTIATEKEKEKTLYHIVREYIQEKNKHAKIFIVHRLDKDTSGIVVLAKDEKTKKQLQDNWNEFVSLREYIGIVHGTLKKKEDTIIQKLKETKTNLVYVSKDEDAKEAITKYQVLKENENYSMVSIQIETGRKNQIRVAFSSLKNPLVGDQKYGLKEDHASRLYLHANRLKMYYPELKKEILFETPVPTEFKKIMNSR